MLRSRLNQKVHPAVRLRLRHKTGFGCSIQATSMAQVNYTKPLLELASRSVVEIFIFCTHKSVGTPIFCELCALERESAVHWDNAFSTCATHKV